MWAILNFEASGLSDQSYPIEVGYALPDAEGYSLLINPLSAATQWNYWDDFAEQQLHHRSRQELITKGLNVGDVCQHLNQVLGHYEVVLCGSQWDLFWLGRLYQAAHMRPSFLLLEVGQWLKQNNGIERECFKSVFEPRFDVKNRAMSNARQMQVAISQLVE
ncbi:hypothetical protein [Photobacterium damselae]|uniref:hypothetical protein n=1 Tax=Photobacterium damselae TaxID=38293 RepID=UPI002204E384|nr:hypothetical protein [Photobacterium damselae]ELI6448646.1 hypothetical protein [Photobacterium damselae]MDC4167769.1 hypothetical protein [Photobacterium damselae]BDR33919.1 hypothetical protein PDY_09670 [Photobacterium damselae subsp. damselae]